MCRSEDEKAAALAALKANGGKLRKTARDTGIPFSTIQKWRDECTKSGSQKKNDAEIALADLYERLARQVCELLPSAMASADARELGTLLGILTDKMQLLRGEPNNITQQDHNVAGRVELEVVRGYGDWLENRREPEG
ncbi:MAG: hypothetical protein IT209_00685 [Armatimonadetes bacterium]|nr:hypothetical protein [Armatimonadota bacterium]